MASVLYTLDRRGRLEAYIEAIAAEDQRAPVVIRPMCLRGIIMLTAVGLAVEIWDWHRFTGRFLSGFHGLGLAEHSAGTSRAQGPIAKTDNGHARRLLMKAVWHHKKTYRNSPVVMRT